MFDGLRKIFRKKEDTVKESTLDDLLAKLPDTARDAAIIGAVHGKLTNDSAYVDVAIGVLDQEKDKYMLAKLHERKGDIDAAIAFHVEDGDPDWAAEIALKHGDPEHAIELLVRAAEDENKYPAHNYLEAAKITESLGDGRRTKAFKYQAIQAYENKKRHKDAADIAEKLGDLPRALAICEQAANAGAGHEMQYLMQAAKVSRQLGDEDRARSFYVRAIDAVLKSNLLVFYRDDAIKLAKEFGDEAKLLEVYEKVGGPVGETTKLALKHGKYDLAVTFLERAQEIDRAIDLAVEHGLYDQAMTICRERGMSHRIEKILYASGRTQEALENVQEKIDNDWASESDFDVLVMATEDKLHNAYNVYREAMDYFARKSEFKTSATFAQKMGNEELARIYDDLSELRK